MSPARFGVAVALLTGTALACGVATAGDRAEVPVGTSLTAALDATLDSRRHGSGDAFTATVQDPVTDGDRILVPAGATVKGEIVEFEEDPPRLQLVFRQIEVNEETHLLEAELVSIRPREHSEMKDEAAKIGGGAAAGAVLGAVVGGSAKGAVIGAAAGAAAGTGVAMATKERHVYLPAGSRLWLRLEQPLDVKVVEPDEEEAR